MFTPAKDEAERLAVHLHNKAAERDSADGFSSFFGPDFKPAHRYTTDYIGSRYLRKGFYTQSSSMVSTEGPAQ